MAKQVILPALGMAQETGIIVRWLKAEGDEVTKGEPLAEIETDKATVEIEAPASGVLASITGATGVEIPVGQVIASILEHSAGQRTASYPSGQAGGKESILAPGEFQQEPTVAESRPVHEETPVDGHTRPQEEVSQPRLLPASPKARRLAAEQGKNLARVQGTGPGGAVLVADVLAAAVEVAGVAMGTEKSAATVDVLNELTVSNTWRIMAERTTQSWTSVPHFYLVREVNASRLIAWREQLLKRRSEKVTYSDLLVKIVAAALKMHPRVNASWREGKVILSEEVHVGLAVAVEEGLVVPVIHRADTLSLGEIAGLRMDLVVKAQAGKLRPVDISGGTFTISNLGMYNVDAFNAIINSPQAAILAVGRIAERVVPIQGQPAVQPMMVLTLSCDHRVVDGARGAQFLDSVATLIEEPLGLLG